jgi:thiamine transporter ThiT
MMLIVGPVAGIVSGCIIGLFAMIAGKFVKAERQSEASRAAAA